MGNRPTDAADSEAFYNSPAPTTKTSSTWSSGIDPSQVKYTPGATADDWEQLDAYNKAIYLKMVDYQQGNHTVAEKKLIHKEAQLLRAEAAKHGIPTYKYTDSLEYTWNYSPTETQNRPPNWMDWDDDGAQDTYRNGGVYDAKGNRIDTTVRQGDKDFIGNDIWENPDKWKYEGPNSGGYDKKPVAPTTPLPTSTGTPPEVVYIPPPPPPAPTPPPAPGTAPKFHYENVKEVSKYEYVYGIKDLRISGKEYLPKSVYVSKPIEVEGNVMEVSLHSVEDHPLFDDILGEAQSRQTSIEYYVAFNENPSLSEWYPILPEGQKEIKSELLIFDTAQTAALRFPAQTYSVVKPTIYKNGLKMAEPEWAFSDGGTKIQLLTGFDPSATYTISYVPNAEIVNPWTIEIKQYGLKTVKHSEVFKDGTTSNKTITLSKYPYIDYEKINLDGNYNPNSSTYKPVTVSLKNANIAGPNRTTIKQVDPYMSESTTHTYNTTNYKTGEWRELNPYKLDSKDMSNQYTVFEYFHDGKKITLSETFNRADILTNAEVNHGNAEIQVDYEYLVSSFRVKIILRRNALNNISVSPIVDEYKLKFKVMK